MSEETITEKVLEVDETLEPLTESGITNKEFQFLAEMLGGLNDIDKVLKSFQNKLLIANMKLPIGEKGSEDRMRNRVEYEFFNKLRTAIFNFQQKNKR